MKKLLCYLTFAILFASCITGQSVINPVNIVTANKLLHFNRAGTTASIKASYISYLDKDDLKEPLKIGEIEYISDMISSFEHKVHRQKKITDILCAIEVIDSVNIGQCMILTRSEFINISSGIEYTMSTKEYEDLFNLISSNSE